MPACRISSEFLRVQNEQRLKLFFVKMILSLSTLLFSQCECYFMKYMHTILLAQTICFQTNSWFKCSSISECLGHLPHKGSVTLCFVLYLCCCENLALAWHFHAQANVCKMIQLSKLSAANNVWYKFNWNEYIYLYIFVEKSWQ